MSGEPSSRAQSTIGFLAFAMCPKGRWLNICPNAPNRITSLRSSLTTSRLGLFHPSVPKKPKDTRVRRGGHSRDKAGRGRGGGGEERKKEEEKKKKVHSRKNNSLPPDNYLPWLAWRRGKILPFQVRGIRRVLSARLNQKCTTDEANGEIICSPVTACRSYPASIFFFSSKEWGRSDW